MLTDYCEAADVQHILLLTDTELATYATELAVDVISASGLVDGLLKIKGLTVPAVVPQLVKDAARFFIAWIFRRKRDPTGAEAFWVEANRFLDAYVEAEAEPYVGSV